MELFILIIALGILAETSFLTVKAVSKKASRVHGKRKIYVDTSALIDGRILDVTRTGFLSDDFMIPRSVTREMQLLADGKDAVKRERARKGLDTVRELERVEFINTEIFDDSSLGRMPVDERLLALAKENRGIVLTNDFNLQKVAATEHVETLNINELALVFNNQFQVGDRYKIRITERGSNPGQGVGHLNDGSMVVVDGAGDKINREIDIVFVRFLQTPAGRMAFAEVAGKPKNKSSNRGRR